MYYILISFFMLVNSTIIDGEAPCELNCRGNTSFLEAPLFDNTTIRQGIRIANIGQYQSSHHSHGFRNFIDCPKPILPKSFTPTCGLIEEFRVSNYHELKLTQAVLRVVNRWGYKVFETYDLSIGWDGTHESSSLPDGIYYWELRGNCNEMIILDSGQVRLIR